MADRAEGTATAELAVAMPAVVMAMSAVLAVSQAALAQVQCVDAARAGARAAARGEPPSVVQTLARDGAPGASVDVQLHGAAVTVSVSRPLRLVLSRGPVVRVRGRATAQVEQVFDRGSASVLVVGVCLLALVLATGAGAVGSAVIARHQAQAAADLAALAAADVLLGRSPGPPCVVAAAVASRNGAELDQCAVTGREVIVRAKVRPATTIAAVGDAAATARAGPAG